MMERHGETCEPAKRMDDDHRASDAELLRSPPQRFGLNHRRGGVAAAKPVAPSMAGPVEAEHAEPGAAQPGRDRNEQVGGIAGGAVNEKDRAALFAFRRPLEHADRAAADLHPRSVRGIALLDAARLNGGQRAERTNQDQKEKNDGHDCLKALARTPGLTAPARRSRP